MSDPQTINLPPLRTADGGILTWTGTYTPPPPVVVTPPPDPTPVPVPVPTPPPPHGQRRMLWHHGWSGPALGKLPTDVRARLTGVTLAMAQSAAAGTGRITDPPGVTAQEVHALVADGIDVFTGIGGSGTVVSVSTTPQIDDVVRSVLDQQKRFGITGIRWDLEDSPGSSWTVEAVVAASTKLLDAGLKVGMWSGTWGGRLAAWGAVAKALGDRLDGWERCYYDFPEASSSALVGVVNYDLPLLRPYVAREDQLLCSFAPVGSMSATSTDVMTAAYAAARKLFPLAGYSVWEDYQDGRAGWTSSRALAKV